MLVGLSIVALSVCAQLPLSTSVQLPSGKTVNLAADFADTISGGQKLSAHGNVELSSGNMVVRADELTYDAESQIVTAKGNVRFFDYPYVGVADQVTVDIDGRAATLQGGLFMKKRGVSNEQLLAAKSVDELKSMGDSQLSVTGTSIRQLDENTFEVENLSFTPCDCDVNQITWRVEARKANVRVGERATLTFPVVYVQSVPVFALPWLYLPVTERRSGLLVPKPQWTPNNGFSIDQPVFVTLGESYDATITPGYYFGSSLPNGVKGPRLQTEFRYVPSTRTTGRATLGLIYDFKPRRDPFNGQPALFGTGQKARGLRAEGSLSHDQDLTGGWRDRIDASFVSDGFYPRDLTADILARENQYLRSTGVIYRHTDNLWTGLDVTMRQDLRSGFSLFYADHDQFGRTIRGSNTMQRLPALSFVVPEHVVAGPIHAGFSSSFVRIAPMISNTGDEGRDGISFQPELSERRYDCDETAGNGRFDGPGAITDIPVEAAPRFTQDAPNPASRCPVVGPGEREARMRIDLNPRVSAALNLGRFATFTPYSFFREDLYYGEATGNFTQRGYAAAGAVATTELSRVYEWKQFQFRHAVTPTAEIRYVPFVLGSGAGAYDEVDTAIPGRFLQGVAELRQQVMRKEGAQYHESLRFDLGQGFDLMNDRVADSYARLGFDSAPVHLNGLGRYNLKEKHLTQISAGASIDDGRGDAVYASYDRLLVDGSERLRRGIDALVGLPVVNPTQTDPYAEQISAGIRFGFKFGLGARYDAVLAPLRPSGQASGYSVFRQQTVGLSYGPACDCWRLEGQAVFRPGLPVQGGFSFSISRFGSFGTGG
ncbi:MAG: LPS-assembly protein LptD [Myxococcaceae bacterium]